MSIDDSSYLNLVNHRFKSTVNNVLIRRYKKDHKPEIFPKLTLFMIEFICRCKIRTKMKRIPLFIRIGKCLISPNVSEVRNTIPYDEYRYRRYRMLQEKQCDRHYKKFEIKYKLDRLRYIYIFLSELKKREKKIIYELMHKIIYCDDLIFLKVICKYFVYFKKKFISKQCRNFSYYLKGILCGSKKVLGFMNKQGFPCKSRQWHNCSMTSINHELCCDIYKYMNRNMVNKRNDMNFVSRYNTSIKIFPNQICFRTVSPKLFRKLHIMFMFNCADSKNKLMMNMCMKYQKIDHLLKQTLALDVLKPNEFYYVGIIVGIIINNNVEIAADLLESKKIRNNIVFDDSDKIELKFIGNVCGIEKLRLFIYSSKTYITEKALDILIIECESNKKKMRFLNRVHTELFSDYIA